MKFFRNITYGRLLDEHILVKGSRGRCLHFYSYGTEEGYAEKVLEMNDVYNEYIDASKNLLPTKEVESVEIEHYSSQYGK